MNILKRIWARLEGWRTIVINLAMAIGFALAEVMAYMAVVDWREFIDPIYAPWVVVGINVLNIILRHITTKPASTKQIGTKLRGKFKS